MFKVHIQCASCNAAIAFTDDNLLLGSKSHNCSLFMTGYIRERKANRILLDRGLAINIMSKSTMHGLSSIIEELLKSRIII